MQQRCKSFDLVADLLLAHCHFFSTLENIQMNNMLQPFTDIHNST
jgi:hypothetical protein